MNRILSLILSIITALSGFVFSIPEDGLFSYNGQIEDSDISQLSESSGYVKNTMLVIFEEDASLFDKISVFSKAGTLAGIIDDLELYVVSTDNMSYTELNALCDRVSLMDNVALACICPAKKLSEQYTPDDPFTDGTWFWDADWDDENPGGNNWHIEATDTRAVWGYKSLFNHINIGVVDGGYDTEHPELKGKITFPTKREENKNRPNNHGTHVAGIIAAEQDNGAGISGICPDSTLVCVDWSPSTNQLWIPDLEVLQGLRRVVKAGAKVINFSVGSSTSMGDDKHKYPSIVTDLDGMLYSYSMGSLLQKGYDFVVVQSAGNGNGEGYAVDAYQNCLFCSISKKNAFLPFTDVDINDVLDRVIIVGSAGLTENGYMQSSSSNIGDRVDVCAPGVDIYSCTRDNTYLHKSGTSMAAPVVTGIAALVWCVNPELTGVEVKKIVCENTKDQVLPSDERHYDFLNYKTYPLVNAKLAVEASLLAKGGFSEVSIDTDAKEEVTFTNENGDEFIFETDSQGNLTCVLEKGNYTLKTSSGVEEIVV